MSAYKLIRWMGPLVAAFVLALVPGVGAAQSDVEGTVDPLARYGVEDQEFALAGPRYSIPEDGWPQFEHHGVTLKFGAPTPTVPLDGAERKQWGVDLMTFQFDKLRDRQPLYVYYLWPQGAEKAEAEEMMKAVLDAVVEAGQLSTAIGVEYDISGAEFPVAADLYRRAAVPVKWDDASYSFIMSEYDPATIAELVEATATALPTGTYTNFGAVEYWSALAQTAVLETGSVPSEQLPSDAAIAYWKTVSKGPFTWPELTPVASFIAVDQKLDIEGLDAQPILTSKKAWSAMWELDADFGMNVAK